MRLNKIGNNTTNLSRPLERKGKGGGCSRIGCDTIKLALHNVMLCMSTARDINNVFDCYEIM